LVHNRTDARIQAAINSNGTSPGPAAHLTGEMAMTVVGGIATAVAAGRPAGARGGGRKPRV